VVPDLRGVLEDGSVRPGDQLHEVEVLGRCSRQEVAQLLPVAAMVAIEVELERPLGDVGRESVPRVGELGGRGDHPGFLQGLDFLTDLQPGPCGASAVEKYS
jgi:hypothetical protein